MYFEPVFGIHLVAFRLRVVVVTKIVLLSVGPVLLASLGYYLFQQSAISTASPWRIGWRANFRGYGRFWLAFILGAVAQTALVVSVLKLNPNVRRAACSSSSQH
jgi:zinc transporter ZupT